MQDAAEVVGALKSVVSGASALKDAISIYEEGMRPRGARDVALSLETAKRLLVSNLKDSPMFKVGLQKMDGQTVVEVPNAVQVVE